MKFFFDPKGQKKWKIRIFRGNFPNPRWVTQLEQQKFDPFTSLVRTKINFHFYFQSKSTESQILQQINKKVHHYSQKKTLGGNLHLALFLTYKGNNHGIRNLKISALLLSWANWGDQHQKNQHYHIIEIWINCTLLISQKIDVRSASKTVLMRFTTWNKKKI